MGFIRLAKPYDVWDGMGVTLDGLKQCGRKSAFKASGSETPTLVLGVCTRC